MDPLEVLAAQWEGSLSEVLYQMKQLIEAARSENPTAAALIDAVLAKLPAEIGLALTPEAMHSGVIAALKLFTDFKFGEPNEGAGAIQ
jgi:hypothetical protein